MDSNKKNSFFSAMLVSLLAFCLCFTSCGPSAAEVAKRDAIMSVPFVEAVPRLSDKLIWLQGNAQSGENYILEIDSDEYIYCASALFSQSCYELSYKDKSNITITLRGIGANRTINNRFRFTVGSGVTLILDDNITLQDTTSSVLMQAQLAKSRGVRIGDNSSSLVEVYNGGTLVMNDGSAITGRTISNNSKVAKIFGAGVYVSDGGTFIMKGGTISGNTVHPIPQEIYDPYLANSEKLSCAAMGGCDKNPLIKKQINTVTTGFGGGVYVDYGTFYGGATFIKTGGTITGYSSDPENGNVVRNITDGNPISNHGHAIYFAGENWSPKAIDTTVGPEVSFYFRKGFKDDYESDVKKLAEIQDTVQKVPQKTAIQEAKQEYLTAMQKMQAAWQEIEQKEYRAILKPTEFWKKKPLGMDEYNAMVVELQKFMTGQEYNAIIQKYYSSESLQEAKEVIQKKYQNTIQTIQEAQQEMQDAMKKYKEATQKGR